ncbi:MAG: DUF2752 domain-containing protein [Myxococcota bacterium]|nr:DUF2752 domain-containing protein [Myxococcota bacterium]
MRQFRKLVTAAALIVFTVVRYLLEKGFSATDIAAAVPWKCPSFALFSILCPSCGLTRSVVIALSGNWTLATSYHPLGPSIVVLLFCCLVSLWLPVTVNNTMRTRISNVDARKRRTAEALVYAYALWGFFVR